LTYENQGGKNNIILPEKPREDIELVHPISTTLSDKKVSKPRKKRIIIC
jgi:hypothetical protein